MNPELNIQEMYNVKKKVALVTGGGSGIGLMIATALVQNGCSVYIASRKLNVISKVAIELNALGCGKCYPVEANLGSKAGVDLLVEIMRKHVSKLDILVNNSGMAWGGIQ
jgi:NADP-dependent 3-hydroxy acid dehydrogenase YdfG